MQLPDDMILYILSFLDETHPYSLKTKSRRCICHVSDSKSGSYSRKCKKRTRYILCAIHNRLPTEEILCKIQFYYRKKRISE